MHIHIDKKRPEHVSKTIRQHDEIASDAMKVKLTNHPYLPDVVGFGHTGLEEHEFYKEIKQAQKKNCQSYKIWKQKSNQEESDHEDFQAPEASKDTDSLIQHGYSNARSAAQSKYGSAAEDMLSETSMSGEPQPSPVSTASSSGRNTPEWAKSLKREVEMLRADNKELKEMISKNFTAQETQLATMMLNNPDDSYNLDNSPAKLKYELTALSSQIMTKAKFLEIVNTFENHVKFFCSKLAIPYQRDTTQYPTIQGDPFLVP